jgi:hypothetical protein
MRFCRICLAWKHNLTDSRMHYNLQVGQITFVVTMSILNERGKFINFSILTLSQSEVGTRELQAQHECSKIVFDTNPMQFLLR